MIRILTAIGLATFAGCSQPDERRTFPSPAEGLFYTVEKYYAGGPVSDTDSVTAHLEHNGDSSSAIVLNGGDLTVTDIRWRSQNDVTICIEGGITDTFRNQVTVIAGELSVMIRKLR
jgi:hypothetical protein